MSSKIGFVGLGIMGRPMAKNLLKAGHSVTVYDIMPAGMDDVVAAGAAKGTSPKDVAAQTDIIITMVPDGPEVEQAVLAPNGVLEGAKKGAIVIDMHLVELLDRSITLGKSPITQSPIAQSPITKSSSNHPISNH